MKCPEFNTRLHEWLDARRPGSKALLPFDAEAREHAAQCGVCRDQLAAAQRMMSGVRLWTTPKLSGDFASKVVLLAKEDRVKRHRRFVRRIRVTLVLAASILVMVIAGYIIAPGIKKDEGPVARHDTTKKEELPKEVPSPPALAKSLDEAQSSMTALTGRLKEQTLEHTKHLLAATPSLPLPPKGAGVLPEEPIDATGTLRKAGQEISEGLEPVTRSARRAMNLLMREVSTFEVSKLGS